MHASSFDCLVTEVEYLSNEIIRIAFRPNTLFHFAPGQFLSLIVPGNSKSGKLAKRCYSFALAPEMATQAGYEICVKLVNEGRGSAYLRDLRVGDRFKILAPYGHFKLQMKPEIGPKNLCLIATGTGIAPFRSMLSQLERVILSGKKVRLIVGVRSEDEVIFSKEFQRAGIDVHYCVSQPGPNWAGRKGRVTDILEDLRNLISFSSTDFYLCGNGNMVSDVSKMLIDNYGVSTESVISENFAPSTKKAA